MNNYSVMNRCHWDGVRPVREHDTAIPCANRDELLASVDELSGRASALGIPSVARRLRERGRVYIAPARGRIGVLVERVL